MKIDATGSTTPSPTTGGTQLQGTKDEFLRLFMAQLQHQDPFAPTSGADMVAQLAQLSSVEQSKQINDRLAELADAQSSAASAGMSSLVGRECGAATGEVRIDERGAPPPLEVTSAAPMRGASIVIADEHGKTLRTLPVPNGTTATVAWDGKDASGNPVAPGAYKVTVEPGQTTSAINAVWRGRIDAVELTADGPRLRMGTLLLMPGDIRTIGPTTTLPGASA